MQVLSSEDPGFVADFIAQNSSIVYQDKQQILEQPHPRPAAGADREAACKRSWRFYSWKTKSPRRSSRTSTRGSATELSARAEDNVIRGGAGRKEGRLQADSEGYQEKIRALKLPGGEEPKQSFSRRRASARQAAAEFRRGGSHPELSRPGAGASVEHADERAAGREGSGKDSRRGPLRSRAGRKAGSRNACRAAACPRASGADSLPGRSSGCRQNVDCDFHRAGAEPQACAHLGSAACTDGKRELRGHRKTYIGAMPGRIMTGISQAKRENALLLLVRT